MEATGDPRTIAAALITDDFVVTESEAAKHNLRENLLASSGPPNYVPKHIGAS